MSLEVGKELITKLREANPNIASNTVVVGKYRYEPYVRIKLLPQSGVDTKEQVAEVLANASATIIQPAKASGGALYKDSGFLIDWKGNKFLLLAQGIIGTDQVRRKETSPAALGLAGRTFTTSLELYSAVMKGISDSKLSDNVKHTLASLVDSCTKGTDFEVTSTLKSNFIQSDFGEVLGALYLSFNKIDKSQAVRFPNGSNNAEADVYVGNVGYSVKAPNGDHINLKKYINSIKPVDSISSFFYGCAKQDKELMVKSAGGICKELREWVESVVGGVSEEHIKQFQTKVTYQEFIDWVKSHQNRSRALGIPKTIDTSIKAWNDQQTDPFYFTFITLAWKYWTVENAQLVSEFGIRLFNNSNESFLIVNLNKKTKRVEFEQIKFNSVSQWYMWYNGSATGALKNYPSICRMKLHK
jgi:hypothetical protein